MSDLNEWLTQILDVDERAAKHSGGNITEMQNDNYGQLLVPSSWVLADIAAKREILALHAEQEHPLLSRGKGRRYPSDDLRPVCSECSGNDDPYLDQVAHPCETVRLLASAYADRPGYSEEWRVDTPSPHS